MSERENNVYKAKLAEQAERYDGESCFKINEFSRELHRMFQKPMMVGDDDGTPR